MASIRTLSRFSRLASRRHFTTTARFEQQDFSALNARANDTAPDYRKFMNERPPVPHMTNTNSTIANEMPNLGSDGPPPELITAVDKDYVPKDSKPENTERMTGGTQKPAPDSGPNQELNVGEKDLNVGEIEGGTFKVEPLRRTGEDANTTRARLLYQSRKRGTLESDLLLSTFADANLGTMSPQQLQQYDLFLDENDWDIYYWATQEPTPTSMMTADGGSPKYAAETKQGKDMVDQQVREKGTGEWAQTVGTFKPAYRPVPARWKHSEILSKLRKHVIDRSAGGVHIPGGEEKKGGKKGQSQGIIGAGGSGLGPMPELRTFDQ